MCAQDESPLYHSKEIYNKIAIKRPLTNKELSLLVDEPFDLDMDLLEKRFYEEAAIAQWICLRLPSCGLGFESQVHQL